ncbi:hypothetical protein BDF21DRAFT_447809 [Thamnidium elegans]|uniref:W2 domain-containing protein n=1 Tax=Thamnidium elegans TaxID=101142 RepID=A0A8H7W0P6_9FUNG|nr:hypothetical protein INT48_005989 [Thamnidium elegans]KAI8095587.1 hypothetical protein BDF21DRAFT_447809 [Thamnidium elegans]
MKEDYAYSQRNLIDILDSTEMEYYLNHKSLAPLRKVPVCIAAAVYRISAGNCMPYTGTNPDQKLLAFNAYQRNESPWDSYKRKMKPEDNSSCSTVESTCSSRSDSPEPKHHHSKKKPSYHMLRREIRRLRGENAFLRSSVSILKNDLRDSTLSRQNADIIHQRTFQEYDILYKNLEQEIVSKRDEVEYLKEQVERLKLHSLSNNNPNYLKRNETNSFGCFDFEQDNDVISCQPIAQESALPEVNIKMDELKTNQETGDAYFKRRLRDEGEEYQEECEEEEEDEKMDPEIESFEKAASSYIRQAIIAKLSCARVRLDFDDLILKHEPSNDTIMSVLADAFVYWLNSIWIKSENKLISAHKLFTNLIQPGIDDFWKSILQCYTIDYECQVNLLNYIEDQVKQLPSNDLLDHFNRLLICLYKYEILEEEAIVAWYTNPMHNDDMSKHVHIICKDFIEYLECTTEEEEEEEDDDDDVTDNEDYIDEEEEDDDDISFEFMDSPIPHDEDIGFTFGHDLNEEEEEASSLHDSIEDFLTNKERDPCICQFNYDNDTTNSPLSSHPPSPTTSAKHDLPECSCDSTYSPVTEKKKKSVRIAM